MLEKELKPESADMELPSTHSRAWRLALAFSLLLHGGLLAAVLYFAAPFDQLRSKPQIKTIKATAVTHNPQTLTDENTATLNPDSALPAPANPLATPPTQVTEEVTVTPTPSPTTPTPVRSEPPKPNTSGSNEVDDTTSKKPDAIDPATLQQTLTDSLAANLRGQLGKWMEECARQHQRNALAECDDIAEEFTTSEKRESIGEAIDATFNTYVDQPANASRESKVLLAKMDELRPLLDDDSELGLLARQSYKAAESAYCLLNACRTAASAPKLDPTKTEAIRHDTVIKIIGVGK
jgi:hypothetical protein